MLHYTKYAKKGVFSNPCFPFTDIYIYIYIYIRDLNFCPYLQKTESEKSPYFDVFY